MSFNPYNVATKLPNSSTLVAATAMMTMNENNDTKMSNNEAFLAFLQKNDDNSDEEE